MGIESEVELMVLIPCDFIHLHHHNRHDQSLNEHRELEAQQSAADNASQTDREAARGLGEEDAENAASSLRKHRLRASGDSKRERARRRKQIVNRRKFTMKDTADEADGECRRRYKRISHIYKITRPVSRRRQRRRRPRSVKRRNIRALATL